MANQDLFTAPWFPYYFERFEGSDRVAAMSLAEEGAYHRTIRILWKYGSVPSDPKLLAAKIQKRCTEKIAAVVLGMLEPVEGNPRRMMHPTVEEIRIEQQTKYLNRVKGGKAASEKRDKQKTSSISPAQLELSSSISPAHNQIQIQNQIKESDFKRLIERVREDFPKLDERIIEIGMLYTLLQRNGTDEPIRSTKYFHPEIKKVASSNLGEKAVQALLDTRRKQLWTTQ